MDDEYLDDTGEDYPGDPQWLVRADEMLPVLINQESGYRAKAVSPKGARGYMQLMPQTARSPGYGLRPADINNPYDNYRLGRQYLAKMLEINGGDPVLAAAAYNAGQGAVDKYGGVPPFAETQKYVRAFKGTGGRSREHSHELADVSPQDFADWQNAQMVSRAGGGAYGPERTAGLRGYAASNANAEITNRRSAEDTLAQWKAEGQQAAPRMAEDVLAQWKVERDQAPQMPPAAPPQPDQEIPVTTLPGRSEMTFPGKLGDVGRNLAVGAKGLAAGALETTYPLAYPLWYGLHKAGLPGGGPEYEPSPANVRGGLESLGLPKAETRGERLGEIGAETVGALAIPFPGAKKAPSEMGELVEQGLKPTIGQAVGPKAALAESKLTSIPVLGGGIRRAQRAATESANTIAYNEILKPYGETVGEFTGHNAIKHVRNVLAEKFNEVIPDAPVPVGADFANGVESIKDMASQLPDDIYNTFRKVANKWVGYVSKNLRDGKVDPEVAHEAWMGLKEQASTYINQPGAEGKLGKRLYEVADEVENLMSRASPKFAKEADELNKAWGKMLRVSRAAGATGAKEGIWTPAQLKAAARSMDLGRQKRGFAEGEAVMQDMAEKLQRNVGNAYPDTGTVGRGMLDTLLLGGAGYLSPWAAAGVGAGRAMYTKPINDALARGIVKAKDFPFSELLRNYPTVGIQQLMENLQEEEE